MLHFIVYRYRLLIQSANHVYRRFTWRPFYNARLHFHFPFRISEDTIIVLRLF